jgi:hypothetical protein
LGHHQPFPFGLTGKRRGKAADRNGEGKLSLYETQHVLAQDFGATDRHADGELKPGGGRVLDMQVRSLPGADKVSRFRRCRRSNAEIRSVSQPGSAVR